MQPINNATSERARAVNQTAMAGWPSKQWATIYLQRNAKRQALQTTFTHFYFFALSHIPSTPPLPLSLHRVIVLHWKRDRGHLTQQVACLPVG